jgi:hypothetical protein
MLRRHFVVKQRYSCETLEPRRYLADFGQLANNLDTQLQPVETAIKSALNLASHVPLLNNELGERAAVLAATTIDKLSDAVAAATDAASLQQKLFDTINPTGLLGDIDNANGVTKDDVKVFGISGGLEFELRLHKTLADVAAPTNFSIGLDGLPLNVSSAGTANLKVGFDYQLAVKLFDAGSVELDPSKKLNDFRSDSPASQIDVSVEATLSDNFEAQVIFGFLKGKLTNKGNNSDGNTDNDTRFRADFLLDNVGGGGTPTVGIGGRADLNFGLQGSFAVGGADRFPAIGTDIAVHWAFDKNDARGSSPTVSFHDVSFTLGSFLSGMVGPVMRDVQKVSKTMQPVVDILKTTVPGISDLSQAVGGPELTIKDLMKLAAATDQLPPDIDRFLELVTTASDIVERINAIDLGDANNISLKLGDFGIGGGDNTDQDLRKLLPGSLGDLSKDLTNLIVNPGAAAQLVKDQLQSVANGAPGPSKEVAAKALAILSKFTDGDGVEFHFPFFEDPKTGAFRLLLGQDVDLFTFDAKFSQDAGQPNGPSIFGLAVGFTGFVHVDFAVHLAFDTYGLRQFLNGGDAEDILNGFYIHNDAHLNFAGKIQAFAGAGVGFASISVDGGLFTGDGGITVKLHDPHPEDGILRLGTELDPGCLFDVSGEMKAGISINVKVGFEAFGEFIGYSKDFGIADVTLLKFPDPCLDPTDFAPPPAIAGIDPSDPGQLDLYMGPLSGKRVGFDTNDGSEKYEVVRVFIPNVIDGIAVTAFGFTQFFSGVDNVYAEGGFGDDQITIAPDVDVTANLYGDFNLSNPALNDDQRNYAGGRDLLAAGKGGATLEGGGAADRIFGSPQQDVIDGGAGDDLIVSGNGGAPIANVRVGDKVNGRDGNDTIICGDGDDDIFGDNNDDQITPGKGFNIATGGFGNDTFILLAGVGRQTVNGNDGTDKMAVDGTENADTFTVTPKPLAVDIQTQAELLTGTSIEQINLDGRDGADSITVNDASNDALAEINLNQLELTNVDDDNDAITVNGTSSADGLTVTSIKAKGDTFETDQLDVQGLPFKLHVPNKEDTFTLNGLGGVDTLTLDTIVAGVPVSSSGKFFVNGGDDGDTIKVKSALGDAAVDGGAGNDTVSVSSDGTGVTGQVKLAKPLAVDGGAGSNALNVSNAGDPTADSVTVSSTQIASGVVGYTVNYLSTGGSFGGGINLYLGAGNDNVNVQGTLTGSPTTIYGGDGDDAFSADSNGSAAGGSVDGIASVLKFDGQGGTNNTAVFEDENDSTGDVLHVNPLLDKTIGAAAGDTFFGTGGSAAYANLARLTLNTSNGGPAPGDPTITPDTIYLAPDVNTTFSVNAGWPHCPMQQYQLPGDALYLDFTGVTGRHLGPDPSDPDAPGAWTFTNRAPVYFTGIEKMNHVGAKVIGPDAGLPGIVKVIDAETGDLRLQLTPFGADYKAGIRVAIGDINCDSVPDIVVGTGPGVAPTIRVFNGFNGKPFDGGLAEITPYDPSSKAGVYVAVADINRDGISDIITSPDAGTQATVKVFYTPDHDAPGATWNLLYQFDPYGKSKNGVRVAVGDVNGDGRVATTSVPDIITVSGPGNAPEVRVWDGTNRSPTQAPIGKFLAFDKGANFGLYVAAGDVNSDGRAEVIIGEGAGGKPLVRVFSGASITPNSATLLGEFQAFESNFGGGVRVAAVDTNEDGLAEILVGTGPGGKSRVRTFKFNTGSAVTLLDELIAYDPTKPGGVFVGGGN